jgi:hypothetical protein
MQKILPFVAVLCALWLPGEALAQAPAQAPAAAPPKVSISKFRARQLRHGCAGEAREHGKDGQAGEEFAEACYARELAAIAVRRECRAQGRTKGLANQPLRDFVKQCAAEKKG